MALGITPAGVRALTGACSTRSRSVDEPLAGTAPYARGWLVVEQPGPWGRDALRQSHLDPGVAAALAEQADHLPVRVLLVRRAGWHADTDGPRRVWAAFTEPGRTWLRSTLLDDVAGLLDYRLDALAAGTPPDGWEQVEHPLLFVCTNARRDMCCALRGRPLAAALARAHPSRVWECSHLSGHRFSPTALVLPHGLAYGRLDHSLALRVLSDADSGRVTLDGYRGRTFYAPPAQAAEARVREVSVCLDVDGVRVGSTTSDGDVHHVTLDTPDGQRWAATVAATSQPHVRPESCGRESIPVTSWAARAVTPLAAGT